MRIRTPDGVEIPFTSVAAVTLGPGYSTINRVDRERIVSVRADLDPAVTNANEVLADLSTSAIADPITIKMPFPSSMLSVSIGPRDRWDRSIGPRAQTIRARG